jgi:chromosome partition protein MukB
LCRTLDLQLLVAAPEVARADGNTTYRLVRHTTADGREEVIVSGRRSVALESEEPVLEGEVQAPQEADAVIEPEPEPAQQSLLTLD